MAKQLSYADALKLLGKNDSEVLAAAEKLADGGLGALGVPDLFGIRGMVVGKGRKALEGMRDKLRGESRMSRTEKILAAERILVVVSFFEAVEEAWEQAGMPFPFRDLEITAEEQTALVGRLLSDRPPPVPSPAAAWHGIGHGPGFSELTEWEHTDRFEDLELSFLKLVTGLAVAEAHGIADVRHPSLRALGDRLAETAALRHDEHLRSLSGEVPEFAMWMHEQRDGRIRGRLDTGLAEVSRLLESIASNRPVDRRRAELSALYRNVLHRPVLPTDDGPVKGLVLPSLEKTYISPRGRIAVEEGNAVLFSEKWWSEISVTDDIAGFVSAHLVHPQSTETPTVILGHPGSGKSKFTEMLAAQLPPSDFLPIRVELRSVPPNAPIPLQIEEGLAAYLHTRVSWRDLADSTDGALPVIILDGFDELLQATGVDRSDYLEQVQEFQRLQEAMGLPVAVIVTSRTVVADRARFPIGTTVVKLEPFNDAQIDRFLQVWKRENDRPDGALRDLTTEVVLRYRDLAEQPLLLAMLLIYDAEDGALRSAVRNLTHRELYERLLTKFTEREVKKHRSSLEKNSFDRAVEGELRCLEITAVAMFTRRRQHVTAEELNRDLAVLMPGGFEYAADPDLHGRIAPAHQVLSRFFFVHEARAQSKNGTASTFEFLHATFGEHLVARAVVAALDYLNDTRKLALHRRRSTQAADDGELYALLSFACLSGREKIVDFVSEELRDRFSENPEKTSEYSGLLIELFQEAAFPTNERSYSDYTPTRLPSTIRQANYTANLVILLILSHENPVDIEEIFPESGHPLEEWKKASNLWSSLHSSEWLSLLNTIRVKHVKADDGTEQRRSIIVRESGEPVNMGECIGFIMEGYENTPPFGDFSLDIGDPYQTTIKFSTSASQTLRSTSLCVNDAGADVLLRILPYIQGVSEDFDSWHGIIDGKGQVAWLKMHEVLRLRLELPRLFSASRTATYRRLLSGPRLGRLEVLVLQQAAEDMRHHLPEGDLGHLRSAVLRYLDEVRSVETRTLLPSQTVRSVLQSFPKGFPPERVVNRILDLARSRPDPQ
ncbi:MULTISPECIES: NACHT domain-containing protein [Nocardiopsis]|uniref:NACHT N-terminal Helical domain-containing protein n=1 Tax=Nocardiopsis changdeensis TaxID=2831969 RepID=A0ABX8BFK8_9ACTN|nr:MULTISPECIES: hypothetical protein [Nocardiopsis]QUX21020.1 hypothetical protein KGD84_21540 [Nocardiopsis changdeensis]QYX36950.1 hypothetical protein K1J57_30995 [Nocardiopsis sp. MT53]